MASLLSAAKVVLVTGANQGLGHAIIEVAGKRYADNVYVLCSRDPQRGSQALDKLRELGVKARVDVLQLEVTNDKHIDAAVQHVEKNYGRLDVLVNNAGFLKGLGAAFPAPAAEIRSTLTELCDVHITSVAVLTSAFMPLLRQSARPRVINVTSGLASMTRILEGRKMARAIAYGASKVGMNGLTVHLQALENARTEDGPGESKIKYFISNPGVLKTAFTGFHPLGKEPQAGAESVVHLIGDETGQYDGAMEWEFEEGEMRTVPW